MPDSKVKELSDMPWKQREESGTWQKERVIQELRSQGKRMTKQRMILLDVILSGKWNCCKEIYYEAAKRDAAIGNRVPHGIYSGRNRRIQQMLPLQPAGPSLRGGTGRGLDGLDTEQYIWQRRHARSGA